MGGVPVQALPPNHFCPQFCIFFSAQQVFPCMSKLPGHRPVCREYYPLDYHLYFLLSNFVPTFPYICTCLLSITSPIPSTLLALYFPVHVCSMIDDDDDDDDDESLIACGRRWPMAKGGYQEAPVSS